MKAMRFLISFFIMLCGLPAFAQEETAAAHPGMATEWQMNLQAPATPVMEKLYNLHGGLLVLITVITIFVLLLLLYVCVRFSARNNPTPSKTTHNTLVEIIWTSVPILILIGIAIPSLRIHYFMDRAVDAQMTLKVTGYQWYWGYEYPDQSNASFESHIFPNEQDTTRKVSMEEERNELKGEPRLLSVDKPAIVPVDTNIRVLITGNDVIHSWAVPAFGVKMDALPGRINETWFRATQTGTFRGQCSQLCGVWHGFMPIVVKVVSKEEFAAWAAEQKKAAGADAKPAATDAGKASEAPKTAAAPKNTEKAAEPKTTEPKAAETAKKPEAEEKE